MGAEQSIPSTLSREKVYELTRDTRGMMDVLLEYMLKELTVRDFLALSNPAECKKYVIFKANNLYKYFYELQIVPTKDKRGVIVFRPVKELVNPPEGSDIERQSLCLTLAYFYTRIFQIYGALALTLIDDSKFMIESGIMPLDSKSDRKALLPPGYRQYVTSGGERGSHPRAEFLGNFNFLRTYLYDEKDPTRGYLTHYLGEGESRGEIYFLPKIQNRDEYGRIIPSRELTDTGIQKGIFFIGYSGAKKYAQLDVITRREAIGGSFKLQFGKISYYKKDKYTSQTAELGTIIPHKLLTIDVNRTTTPYTYSIRGAENQPISEYFDNIFNEIVPYIKKLSEGETYERTSTVPSEIGTSEELRLSRIIINLTKTKPLGHCLARALQLLKTMPLKGEPGVSNICRTKFLEQTTVSESGAKTTISRSGIPEIGATLDTSPGLAALTQLFYDTIIIGSPKIMIGETPGAAGKESSLQQYMSFMKDMAHLFGDDNPPKPDSTYEKLGLKAIKNQRDRDLCGVKRDQIIVPNGAVKNVYDVVNQLYKIQVQHAAKCGEIIKMLFKLERDKATGRFKISLSDNIIKKGFPEIERINYLSRDVLIQYYKNCETKYIQGMKVVLDSSRPTAPTPTAPVKPTRPIIAPTAAIKK